MKWFVISHPTRGFYTGSEYEWTAQGQKWVPHFAWSITAHDDRVERMYSDREINREKEKIGPKLWAKCTVLTLENQ